MLNLDMRKFMRTDYDMTNTDRRATNVSLPSVMVEEAKTLGINLSRACEVGVEAALKDERERRWKAENAGAVAAYNQWVGEHGLPLEEFRRF
jgi:antitoxin CcdA